MEENFVSFSSSNLHKSLKKSESFRNVTRDSSSDNRTKQNNTKQKRAAKNKGEIKFPFIWDALGSGEEYKWAQQD